MEDKLPTPEELGERLKKGEITEGEAIEIMSERARREAFATLFNPNVQQSAQDEKPKEAQKKQVKQAIILAVVIIVIIVIACLLH